jgi:hypothetical protein
MKKIADLRVDLIKKKNEENDRTKHIHVTDLSRCLSGVWNEKTGRSKPVFNDSKLRRFDAGHNIEERVIEALEDAEVLVSTQGQLVWPEYNMVGSYDAIIREKDDQLWLVEVKSIHPYGITHLYKSKKVHEHYLEQINLYLSKLKEEHPNMKARIYYEALDGRTFEEEVRYDPAIIAEALRKAKMLHEAIATDKMPERAPDIVQENGKWVVNWRMKYCAESMTHYKCDPNAPDPDPKKWINKLVYKAKKMNQ